MCFSATSSFVSGAIVTGLGGLTLCRVRGWDEVLFGSLPLLFGIHQLEEGVVWLCQQGTIDPHVGKVFAWFVCGLCAGRAAGAGPGGGFPN